MIWSLRESVPFFVITRPGRKPRIVSSSGGASIGDDEEGSGRAEGVVIGAEVEIGAEFGGVSTGDFEEEEGGTKDFERVVGRCVMNVFPIKNNVTRITA
jgi:hypothetical protein